MNNKEVFKEKEEDFRSHIKNLETKNAIYQERVIIF